MARYTLKNGQTCVIERVQPGDAAELVAYVNQIAGETDNMTFGGGEFSMSVIEEEQYLRNTLWKDHTFIAVARVDGRIVANINLHGNERQRLQHSATFGISVLKEYWGRGIGKLLMEEMLTYAHWAGLTKINLKTRTDNINAIALYHKFGFTVEGIERRAMLVNDQYVDFLLMGLILD